MKNRLDFCKTCTHPENWCGKGEKCPGNEGLGCIGDWRCCKEMDACVGCSECEKHLYCTNQNCEKIKNLYKDESSN